MTRQVTQGAKEGRRGSQAAALPGFLPVAPAAILASIDQAYLADAVVTLAYKLTLFALPGRVNNSAFKGFSAGECLFLGAAGRIPLDGHCGAFDAFHRLLLSSDSTPSVSMCDIADRHRACNSRSRCHTAISSCPICFR